MTNDERPPHQELQLLLGAYVLGGLDAGDRRRVELHLPACQPCTTELARYAGIPALLQLVPQETVQPPAVPPESLPRLVSAVRARRATLRRRWVTMAAAALVVLCGVVAGMLALTGRSTGPAPSEVVIAFTAGGGRVVGQAVLNPRSWGTEVALNLDYPPRGLQPYTAVAVARDGHEEQAAHWTTPPDGQCEVTGATSIARDDLARIEVRTADGRTLLFTR